MLTDAEIAARYVKIRPYLDERQRRLWLGVEAQALGRAGAGLVARATGSDVKTVRRGRDQGQDGPLPACWPGPGTACRATPRPSRGSSTPTVTPSSGTSTPRSQRSRTTAAR